MKRVYQQIIGDNGDCMKATMCSLLELDYDSIPNFVEYDDWWQRMEAVLKDNGYKWGKRFYNEKKMDLYHPTDCFRPYIPVEHKFRLRDITLDDTINGYAFGSVFSPGYFRYEDYPHFGLHMVVIDINCNIVHDPNPNYAGINHYPFSRLLGAHGVLEAWGVKKL